MDRLMRYFTAILLAGMLAGCGYREFQAQDDAVSAAWAEVVRHYQLRAQLVPELIDTARNASQPATVDAVLQAKSRAAGVDARPEALQNPQLFYAFQQAQGDLSAALAQMLIEVSGDARAETDPALRELQERLHAVENDIIRARERYVVAVREFNKMATRFPTNLTAMALSYELKPTFPVDADRAVTRPPAVAFER
ncbi:MAG TPA: LemA family protein [Noviherbaspirillum sp.]|nr:LemA family protein [Noviherbaspirillum sp.]